MNLRPETRDSLWIGLGTLLLYALSWRERLHHPDAPHYLGCVFRGELASHHFLYLPLAATFRTLLAPFGCDVFVSMLALSVVGGCVASVMAHRTLLELQVPRLRAVLGALLVATCPGVFFFATTVEIHAPFLAVANAAWWSAAAASRETKRRDLAGVFRTGTLTAIAAGVHATGQLLLWPLAVLLWLRGRRIGAALVLVATHLVVVRVLGWLVTGSTKFLDSSGGLLQSALTIPVAVSDALAIAWHEWLLAFLPMSVVALVCTFLGPHRRLAIAVHLALLPYLGACIVVVKGLVEHGAYVLPMALPLAWVVVRALPVRGSLACIAIGTAVALWIMAPFRQPASERAFAADALVLEQQSPMWVLTGSVDEVQALARDATSIALSNVVIMAAAGGLGDDMLPVLLAAWDESIVKARAGGRRMVLTRSALDFLRHPDGGQLVRMMAMVDARYEWHPVEHGAFQGFEPRAK